jgi:hypothetical protein
VHATHCLVDASSLCESKDGLDFFDRWGIADVQYEFISDGLALTGEVAGLDVVDGLAHIAVSDEEQRAEGLLSDLDSFSLDHSLEVELHLVVSQLAEPEDDAATLDGLDDLGGSVAAQHEASGLAKVADDHAQGMLCALRQTVRLVQHDDLSLACSKRHFFLCKRLDLLAHHIYSTLIRSIQLQSCLFKLPLQ